MTRPAPRASKRGNRGETARAKTGTAASRCHFVQRHDHTWHGSQHVEGIHVSELVEWRLPVDYGSRTGSETGESDHENEGAKCIA